MDRTLPWQLCDLLLVPMDQSPPQNKQSPRRDWMAPAS